MEVNNYCQGRQSAIDYSSIKSESSSGVQVQQVSSDSIEVSIKKYDSGSSGQNVSEKDVQKAVNKLNTLFEDKQTHAEYEVYGKFKDITIRIVDDNTKQVIQEIPPKKIIDMIDKLCELAGVLVDERA
jgi:flagellar protein FlaG